MAGRSAFARTSGEEPASVGWRRFNRVVAFSVLVWTLGAVYGLLFSDFVPAPDIVVVAQVLSLVSAVFYGAFALGIGEFGFNRRLPRTSAFLVDNPSTANPAGRVVPMALVMACFAWVAFSAGIPSLLNLVVGGPGTMTVIVKGWEGSESMRRGSTCPKPTVRGVPYLMLGGQALCTHEAMKDRLPPGTELLLIGRVSPLGISATEFHTVSR
jgi:hypothetical protein